jgi:hypothetical protein
MKLVHMYYGKKDFEGAELAEMKDSAIPIWWITGYKRGRNAYWYRDH